MKPLHWKLLIGVAVLVVLGLIVRAILADPVRWLLGPFLLFALVGMLFGKRESPDEEERRRLATQEMDDYEFEREAARRLEEEQLRR